MLTKQDVKACLAGECPGYVPAWLFWMDGKFIEKNRADVDQMRKQYQDDFLFVGVNHKVRSMKPKLEIGEFIDDWRCMFKGASDGVGAHPTRPVIKSIPDWEKYVSEGMPEINADNYANGVKSAVKDNPDRYVVGTIWRTFYERMFMLMGYEELMLEIATDGELFNIMLSVLKDFTIHGIELVAQAGADAIFLADDWGIQDRLMISPASWVKYFKSAYAEMIDVAHKCGLDVWFHSCGNITDTISHWIDIKLDVISPLQTAAMDLPAIAEAYRGRMTFFGGIDVQYNLINGTPDSVMDEVCQIMKMFRACEGKYMFSPCNTIMPETPVRNVWTLFKAIRSIGKCK